MEVYLALYSYAILSLCLLISESRHTSVIREVGNGNSEGKLEKEIMSNWGKFLASLQNRYATSVLHDKMEPFESELGHSQSTGRQMGLPDSTCDNAKINLMVDWDGSKTDFTCYNPKSPYPIKKGLPPLLTCDDIPKGYRPVHVCMNKAIDYGRVLPTHEKHRPLWPVYGEYKYVPAQRWLHSVEHGSVVMLYHPCTEPGMITKLKDLVSGCIRKHVITANPQLNESRPLALVAWGCSLQMNSIDDNVVVDFIKTRALHGPEGHLAEEGQYNWTLIEKAKIPVGSDYNDTVLCPNN